MRAPAGAAVIEMGRIGTGCERGAEEMPRAVEDIYQEAIEEGERRLRRPSTAIFLTGLIAGLNVSLGLLASVAVAGAARSLGSLAPILGALVFPVGFVFLTLGRAELFTENFFIPVAAKMELRMPTRSLIRLWLLTLVGNLIGVLLFAFLASREVDVLSHPTVARLVATATLLTHKDFDSIFISGIFAGWLITLMTWLMMATASDGVRVVVAWTVGFLINLNVFNHVVVNSSEILTAMLLGAPITVSRWLTANFIPTILGNLVGGLGIVAVTHVFLARILRSSP